MNLTKQVDAFDTAEIQARALAYCRRTVPEPISEPNPLRSAVYRAFYEGYMQAWMQACIEARKLTGESR